MRSAKTVERVTRRPQPRTPSREKLDAQSHRPSPRAAPKNVGAAGGASANTALCSSRGSGAGATLAPPALDTGAAVPDELTPKPAGDGARASSSGRGRRARRAGASNADIVSQLWLRAMHLKKCHALVCTSIDEKLRKQTYLARVNCIVVRRCPANYLFDFTSPISLLAQRPTARWSRLPFVVSRHEKTFWRADKLLLLRMRAWRQACHFMPRKAKAAGQRRARRLLLLRRPNVRPSCASPPRSWSPQGARRYMHSAQRNLRAMTLSLLLSASPPCA